MLIITVPETEFFNEETNEFVKIKSQKLQLEHSLVSLSKWESKWQKPFLHTENKTYEMIVDYIKCMTITQNVDPIVYQSLTRENLTEIEKYISDPMTATWFNKKEQKKKSREIITAELIYYWMISLNIPFECQKWHLNRLLTLIQVCSIKNEPSKKMSKRDIYNQNRMLNEARRKHFNTKG